MTMHRRRFLPGLAAVASIGGGLLHAGGSALSQPRSGGRALRVVATFSILADIVRSVADDGIDVSALVGPDADAHVFQPRPTDARRLAAADLVVVNGLGFEGWLERLVDASGYRGPVVVASEGVVARRLGAADDPHAWQDLAHGQRYARNVMAALTRAVPVRAAAFENATSRYLARLALLDAETRIRFEAIPRGRRRIITSHDAFGYFGAAYGIDVLAAQGISTESDPSAASVARLADQVRRQDVQAIFVENISDPRLVERLAKEGGAAIGGKLYSDALSTPGSAADTYLKLHAHNAVTIAAALTRKRSAALLTAHQRTFA